MWGSESQFRDLTELGALAGEPLRAAFRRSLADLAAALAHRPLPLEGVEPAALLAFVRQALGERLFDDLTWLSPASAASVLYELMCALPAGEERDYLAQLVEERLARADATTFVALATLLVQGSRGGLSSLAMRARVSLALSLPIGSAANVDALALALISRPDYAREWVEKPSQGSLPSRRLAARLIERAAREAARRYAERDDGGLRALESAPVKSAWERLLADRESLVWRHVAVARGLLVEALPALRSELERSLEPGLSPTEWRRGAASLAASLAVDRERALSLTEQLLESEVLKRDPGVASCMIMGLSRAAEVEPEAAELLLLPLLKRGGLAAAEACVDLFDEGVGERFGMQAMGFLLETLRAQLEDPEQTADAGVIALIEWLLGRFGAQREAPTAEPDREHALDLAVRRALMLFDEQGSGAAVRGAADALTCAEEVVARLIAADQETHAGRIAMGRALIEIDLGLLQASTLADLGAVAQDGAARERLDRLFEQLADWFVKLEQSPVETASVPHPALRIRRIRALLHAVDAEGSYGDDFAELRRPRRLRVARALLNRVRRETSSVLSRAVIACLSRAFDALVREEVFELSDVVLCASLYVRSPEFIATLAEASMVPELNRVLSALSVLVKKSQAAQDVAAARKESVEALAALTAALPAAHSARVSALRWALVRLHVSLRILHGARSLQQLIAPELGAPAFVSLGDALLTLAQLIAGARRRLNPSARVRPPSVHVCVSALRVACEEVATTAQLEALDGPIADLDEALTAELSPPFHAASARVLESFKALPLASSGRRPSFSHAALPSVTAQKLPGWLPASRLLGGFYVVSALGEGAGGSVFMARRAEERDDEAAEVFALKVPEYNGHVAHLLSEGDFLKMFREEAGALLSLPEDSPNIARFVTFDAGVKPKPILVMEHVEGPSLEKLLARKHIDVAQAFGLLAGIADGLCAMHGAGIAHLDLKPGNVIVRGFWSGGLTPVLVDFGLSGRRLRPGCGTPNYAAPEIWGAQGSSAPGDARAADVYALGCLAYELLTGEMLFNARGDVAIVAAHVSHDGAPPPIQALHRDLALRPLSEWIGRCLRHKPGARPPVAELRRQLDGVRGELEDRDWPLLPASPAAQRIASAVLK
jgi:eukaryotic-like serine/threonine-protein kinase